MTVELKYTGDPMSSNQYDDTVCGKKDAGMMMYMTIAQDGSYTREYIAEHLARQTRSEVTIDDVCEDCLRVLEGNNAKSE